MFRSCCSRSRAKPLGLIILTTFILLATLNTLHVFYTFAFLPDHRPPCLVSDVQTLSNKVDRTLARLAFLQDKLESTAGHAELDILGSEFAKFLNNDVIKRVKEAREELKTITSYNVEKKKKNCTGREDDVFVSLFRSDEAHEYLRSKKNRVEKVNPHGVNETHPTIGHACVSMAEKIDSYLTYKVGSFCNPDKELEYSLMLSGCDPLPRRRCFRTTNESEVIIITRGFDPNEDTNNNTGSRVDFEVSDVLGVKPGEIRIGLDIGHVGTMKDYSNVTIVSISLTTINITSTPTTGVVQVYATLNQRMPFFDNTMDLIRIDRTIDGFDLLVLDFVLFDLNRVLRPGGLLWVDRFLCLRKDLDEYMYAFLKFRYRKHKWALESKSKDEVYLSALLEKTPRSP